MEERRFALLIGNSNYRDPELVKLLAPADDTVDLARVLENPQICDFRVQTFRDQTADKLRREIEKFLLRDRQRDDLLLLYFSGHGITDLEGQLYFAAADTELDHHQVLQSSAISAKFVNELMSQSRSRRIVLLLDCCHSGAFKEGMLAKGGEGAGAIEQLQGQGRIVLTASNALQYSFEGDVVRGGGTRSIFTHVLAQGLETGDADQDGDGRYSIDDLYSYVCDRMRDHRQTQQPMKMAFVEGDIFLGHNPSPKASRLPADVIDDLGHPRFEIRLTAVGQLGKLLQGSHKGKALAAFRELSQLEETDFDLRVKRAAKEFLVQFQKAEAERQSRVRVEAERQARVRAEAERQAPVRAEAERQARVRAEADLQAREKAEADREASEKAAAAERELMAGTANPVTASLEVGTVLQDRYAIERLLVAGGLGWVYLARDQRLANRPCAIKEMVDHFIDQAQRVVANEDFAREADMLAQLKHRAIPAITDRFDDKNRHYLVMEYIEGRNLEEEMAARKGPIPEGLIVDIARQLCDVLSYLHGHEPPVIYRDMKPSNVMVTPKGRVTLIDFGIARLFKGARMDMIGTVGFAPPEQYQGNADQRSDIYSLGATLHYALTGRDPQEFPPFAFPPVKELRPETSTNLAGAIDAALSWEAKKRPASVQQFRDMMLYGTGLRTSGGLGVSPRSGTADQHGAGTGRTGADRSK
jgi:uncharacterized caspase-like protein